MSRAQKIINTAAGKIRVSAYSPLINHGCGESGREAQVHLNGEKIASLSVTYHSDGSPTEYSVQFLSGEEILEWSRGDLWETLEAWGNAPEPAPEPAPKPAPTPDQILDQIWSGEFSPQINSPYSEPGCRLWTLPGGIEAYELRDDDGVLYGYGAFSEQKGYHEALLRYSFSERDALRKALIIHDDAPLASPEHSSEPASPEHRSEPPPEIRIPLDPFAPIEEVPAPPAPPAPPEEIPWRVYDVLDNLGAASVPDNEYTLSEIKALAQRLQELLGGETK